MSVLVSEVKQRTEAHGPVAAGPSCPRSGAGGAGIERKKGTGRHAAEVEGGGRGEGGGKGAGEAGQTHG